MSAMRWLTADAEHRDLQTEWKKLRGRMANIASFTVGPLLLDERLDWKRVPSNQFVSAEDMAAANWMMDQTRDADGRLA